MTTTPDAPSPGNIPEFSVSEISGAVKRTLEGAFGRVRVRGEISETKRYGSGHTYLCLKDEGGKIKAVLWKGNASRAGLKPEDGVEVIATGRISTYGDRSEYQLSIERIEYAGAGALLARVEKLRLRLGAEGLFDPARKRALPVLPAVVGVVTSAQGAVLHDIRTTIARRFPRPILLWPVPVQGEGAAERIAAAIQGFARLPLPGIPRPDVLIVARGGGSLEDLMAFNEEVVVRAAAACPIPLISAVGHETDTTLIDFASDRRAPTPTAAAEMAVPARSELAATLAQEASRLASALARMLERRRHGLHRAGAGLPDLPALLGTARQRVDDRAQRLALAALNLSRGARNRMTAAAARLDICAPALTAGRRARVERLRLPELRGLVPAARGRLDLQRMALSGALRHAVQRQATRAAGVLPRLSDTPVRGQLRAARSRLEGAAARLESVSHKAVLARGYAMVTDAGGEAVTLAAGVAPGMRLRIGFADGEVAVVAEGKQGLLL